MSGATDIPIDGDASPREGEDRRTQRSRATIVISGRRESQVSAVAGSSVDRQEPSRDHEYKSPATPRRRRQSVASEPFCEYLSAAQYGIAAKAARKDVKFNAAA
jgi:hypothetical protein